MPTSSTQRQLFKKSRKRIRGSDSIEENIRTKRNVLKNYIKFNVDLPDGGNRSPLPPATPKKEVDKEVKRLVKLGMTKMEAYILIALRGGGSMVVTNSNGGGRYPAFLHKLQRRGINILW